MGRLTSLAAAVLTTASLASAQTTQPTLDVKIDVDLGKSLGPVKPAYRYFGCDEPNYATTPSGRTLLKELGKLGTPESPVYFRTHNLMCTGDGTPALKWGSTNLYTEDVDGKPIYDFTIVDAIFDAYKDAGVKPYLQLGFMPKALSTKPEPYQHSWTPKQKYDAIFTGWAYPPKDYAKWEEVIYTWTKHCVERYGADEVATWYFETWNEPQYYFKASQDEFHKLNDYAFRGVKRALPNARCGGPDTAGEGGAYMDAFLKHCFEGKNYATGEVGTPLEFLSFHAKGAPTFVDGHVRMGISNQLRELDRGFARYAKDARTKTLPIVIGESDPEGCAACQGPSLGYRNGTMYSSYTAAAYARHLELADRHGVNLAGMLTWAFLFSDQPIFAGFRVLGSASGDELIEHPVLNVFRMLSQMNGERIAVTSSGAIPLDDMLKDGVRGQPDVNAVATRDGDRVAVMLWNYHDDDVAGPAANITLTVRGVTSSTLMYVQKRIDETHGNTFTAWKSMGSPAEPSRAQIRALQDATDITRPFDLTSSAAGDSVILNRHADVRDGVATLTITLPRQAVSLVILGPED